VKKVDTFVLKSFIGPLIFTFFIVLIILILQFLWMYVDELAGKGLDFKIVGELIYHFSISWFNPFLDDFITFWVYLPHPGKAGNLKCP